MCGVCVCGGCVCVLQKKIVFDHVGHKGQRSNLSMQKNLSTPKVYNCLIWFETF